MTVINSYKIVMKRNIIPAQDYFMGSSAAFTFECVNSVMVPAMFRSFFFSLFSPVHNHFAILQPYSWENL